MNDGWLDSLFKNIGKGLQRTIDTQIMSAMRSPGFFKGLKNLVNPTILRNHISYLPRYRFPPRPVDEPLKLKFRFIHDRIWLRRKINKFKSVCGGLRKLMARR